MAGSIVMLSGGLDSTVALKCALDHGPVKAALTFDYGQRAVRREAGAAAAMCRRFRLRHEIVRLPWMAAITQTALVNRARAMPHPCAVQLDRAASAQRTAAHVWVPNRNGVFLAVAAAFAESLHAEEIVPGFNAEEAATFPDNSSAFLAAATRALVFSTRSGVRARCYTARCRKPQIVRLGLKIGAPLDLVWACYEGGRRMCGVCESCLRFVRGVREARAEAWFLDHHAALPRQLLSKRRPS